MHPLLLSLVSALVLGLGGTLTFDLWSQFFQRAFGVAPSNLCLVGRWVSYMPAGTFRHANLAATPPRRFECAVGWIAHYAIGTALAGGFVALAGVPWLQQPTLLPAVAYGLVTVAAPFFIMQPLFGLGLAASKAPRPALARLRTVANHLAFGVGLYLFAVLLNVVWPLAG